MADDKKEAEATAEAAAPSGPKLIMGMPLPIFGFLVLNALVMLGGFGYIFYVSMIYKPKPILEEQAVTEITKKVDKKSAASDASGGAGVFIEQFQEMVVNLKVGVGSKSHFANIEPAIECSNAACIDQVKEYRARLEDLVQTKIASKSFTELNALETRFRLRHEFIQEANTFITAGAVTNLYFTSFLVQ